jgi:2-iminobutanoate/2-iminopropanoate deaminase
MPKKHVTSADAPKPIGPYSQAVISGGLLFASGQIALDPATGQMIDGDVVAQTERVMKNLLAVLKEAKMGPENIVKTTVFLASMADFPKMNEVYEKYLGKEPPARSTIEAGALPKGAKIEIDLIAAF